MKEKGHKYEGKHCIKLFAWNILMSFFQREMDVVPFIMMNFPLISQ